MTAEHNYPVVDPDNVPETICLGNLNVAIGPSGAFCRFLTIYRS